MNRKELLLATTATITGLGIVTIVAAILLPTNTSITQALGQELDTSYDTSAERNRITLRCQQLIAKKQISKIVSLYRGLLPDGTLYRDWLKRATYYYAKDII